MKLKNSTKNKGKREVGTDGSKQKVSQMTVSQLSNDVIWDVSRWKSENVYQMCNVAHTCYFLGSLQILVTRSTSGKSYALQFRHNKGYISCRNC